MQTYLQTYVLSGGPLMIVLILCSLALVGSVVQCMIKLRPARVMPDSVLEKARNARNKNDRIAFFESAKTQTSPLGQSVSLTLKSIDPRADHRPHRRQVEPIVEEAVARVADDLYEDLGRFSTMYTIAPLLGLLGTILGMMNAFREFSNVEDKDLGVLSEGIQQALVTTLWGLAVAITAYVMAQMFQSKVRVYERKLLPEKIDEILGALFPPPRPQEAAGAQPPRPTAQGPSIARTAGPTRPAPPPKPKTEPEGPPPAPANAPKDRAETRVR